MRPATDDEAALEHLLHAVHERFGHDFREYARPTVRRRVGALAEAMRVERIADLVPRILDDELVRARFLRQMSVPVTEMFRDPEFFLGLRRIVAPILRTYPFVNVWHAGCATGEEVYSTAIVFHEEGLLERSRFYATDSNPAVLSRAEGGIYDARQMQRFTASYHRAGGTASFADYYHARYGSARIRDDLRRAVTFAHHDLATDRVFSETNLVVCRNVLIYFNRTLQDRVLELFAESLCRLGILCLGTKETLDFSSAAGEFAPLDRKLRIFRKKR